MIAHGHACRRVDRRWGASAKAVEQDAECRGEPEQPGDRVLIVLGNTVPLKGSNPHDMDLSPDGKTLYFPMRLQGALISFPHR